MGHVSDADVAALDEDLVEVWGETVTYTEAPNPGVSIQAIFFDPDSHIENFPAPVAIERNAPAFLIHRNAVATPRRDSTIVRTDNPDGFTYTIREVEQDESALRYCLVRRTA